MSHREAVGISPGQRVYLVPFMAHWLSHAGGPCSWFEIITEALGIQQTTENIMEINSTLIIILSECLQSKNNCGPCHCLAIQSE